MSRGKINPPTSEMVLCVRTGGIIVTGKELLFKLIDENALDKEISIEINKHDIPINSYKYEYFSVADINVSGNQLIFHVKVEK